LSTASGRKNWRCFDVYLMMLDDAALGKRCSLSSGASMGQGALREVVNGPYQPLSKMMEDPYLA